MKQSVKSHSKCIWHIVLTPNGELISSSGDKAIKIWNIQDGLVQKEFKVLDYSKNEVLSFILRKCDGVLISGNRDGNLFLI